MIILFLGGLMKKTINLISGNITSTLFKLAIPILGTSFVQMAYNLIDMMWVGRISSNAVAAVGTAGFFTWFGSSLVYLSKIGTEIGLAQAIGKNDNKERKKYIYNGLLINMIIAIIYMILILIFNDSLIGFFNLGDASIISMAKDYLIFVALGFIFSFLNPIFTGIFNASGNSRIPFFVNTIGLVINIVFDPILIFGMFGFKSYGVKGAAMATVFAQLVVWIIFIIMFKRNGYSLGLSNKKYIDNNIIKKICKYGLPTALQSCLFSVFAMFIGRIIAIYGAVPIAVQKIGSQIEAISWMTAEGFSAALTAFIGQNFGANKWKRIYKGYKTTITMSIVVGLFASILFIFFGEEVFSLFIKEEETIRQGADYLRILGYSQIFMCIEITTSGAFSGIGNTITPSWVGIVFTGLRIPMAILLSKTLGFGIDGVWMSISLTSVFKGILLGAIFIFKVIIPKKLYKLKN